MAAAEAEIAIFFILIECRESVCAFVSDREKEIEGLGATEEKWRRRKDLVCYLLI